MLLTRDQGLLKRRAVTRGCRGEFEGAWRCGRGGSRISYRRELFYRSGSQVLAVAVDLDPEFTVGRPSLLFEGPFLLDPIGLRWPNYDVSLDGQQFLMFTDTGTINTEDAADPEIVVVENWFQELKKQVPVP